MEPSYNPTGNYTALGSFAVLVLNHYGLIVSQNDAIAVIAGFALLYGILKQAIEHRKQAVAAGAL